MNRSIIYVAAFRAFGGLGTFRIEQANAEHYVETATGKRYRCEWTHGRVEFVAI